MMKILVLTAILEPRVKTQKTLESICQHNIMYSNNIKYGRDWRQGEL